MSKGLRLTLGFVTLFIAAKGAATESEAVIPPPELRGMVVGKTLEIERGERSGIRIKLEADGRAWANYKSGIGAGRINSGSWSFDDKGRLCLDWRQDEGAPHGCFYFVRDGETLRMVKRNKEFNRAVTIE